MNRSTAAGIVSRYNGMGVSGDAGDVRTALFSLFEPYSNRDLVDFVSYMADDVKGQMAIAVAAFIGERGFDEPVAVKAEHKPSKVVKTIKSTPCKVFSPITDTLSDLRARHAYKQSIRHRMTIKGHEILESRKEVTNDNSDGATHHGGS